MRWPEPEQLGERDRSRRAGSAEPGLPRTVCAGQGSSARGAASPRSRGPQDAPASAPARGRAGGRPGSVALPALRGSSPRPPPGPKCQPPRAPHLPQRYLSAPPTYLSAPPTSARSPPQRTPHLPQRTPHLPQRAPHLSALRTYLSALPSPARSLPQPTRARCPGRVNSDPASPQLSVSTHSTRRTHVTPFPKTAAPARLRAGRRPRFPARRREGLGRRRSRK